MENVDRLSNLLTTLYQKRTSDATTEVAGEDNNKREEQLTRLNTNVVEIRDMLKKRISSATDVYSVDTMNKPLMQITTSLTESLQKLSIDNNETIDEQNKDLLRNFVKELEKLQDKNSKEFSKVAENLENLTAQLEKSENEKVSQFGKDAKESISNIKAVESGTPLRGKDDTFYNRLKRSFATQDQVDPVTGVAKIGGIKGLAKNFLRPSEGSLMDELFTSDTKKRQRQENRENRKQQVEDYKKEQLGNVVSGAGQFATEKTPRINKMSDLTPDDYKKLEEKGYMRDGIGVVSTDPGSSSKSLSMDEIRNVVEPSVASTQATPAAVIETPKPIISSDEREIKAGLFEDPKIKLQEKIAENSDKQVELLQDILKELKDGLAQISGMAGSGGGGGDTTIIPVGGGKPGFLRRAWQGTKRFFRNPVRNTRNAVRGAWNWGRNLVRGGVNWGKNLARGPVGRAVAQRGGQMLAGRGVMGAAPALAGLGAVGVGIIGGLSGAAATLFSVDQGMKYFNRESREKQNEGIEQFGLSGNAIDGFTLNGEYVGGKENLREYYKNVVDGYGANNRGYSAQRAREYVQSHNPDGSLKTDTNPSTTAGNLEANRSRTTAGTMPTISTGDNSSADRLGTLSDSAANASTPNINVPAPTVVTTGDGGASERVAAALAQMGGMKNVRANDNTWQRFQDRRSFG